MVIVILGILSATALPKFVDLGKDARLKTIENTVAALKTAATIAHSKCVLSAGCQTGYYNITAPNGVQGVFLRGYPWGGSSTGASGIKNWIDLPGFSLYEYPAGNYAIYSLDSAPTPSNCSVTYSIAATEAAGPTISPTITGC